LTSIPESIKRQVRQEAGFGCCKCGFPIIQYHHIVEDSQDPKDIMLLCPTHHHEATVGAMLEEEQRSYKANPYNIEKGFVEGKLKVNQKTPVINTGAVQLIGDGHFILIDGEDLLSIEINEGKLEISIKLYDQKDNLVAEIQRNEWISGNPLPWDLESEFQWLRLRRKARDIEPEINAKKSPINLRADMWRHGENFLLTPKELKFMSSSGGSVTLEELCFVNMRLEVDTAKKTFKMAPNPRFDEWGFISEPNVDKRIRKGLEKWEVISCRHELVTIIDRKKYAVRKCSKCGKIDKIWK